MSFAQALSDAAGHHDEERYRYYGVVAGTVTTLDDQSLGRVKARLRGMDDGTETDWLTPLWPGGIEGVPHKSDPVMVFFEDGNDNKGAYLWFPSSKTKDRPNEPVPLGESIASILNDHAKQLNQLRTDHNTFVTTIYNAHKHATAGTGAPSVPDVTGTSTTATATFKAQKSDGSAVSEATADKKALSGRVKVGI